MEMESVAELMQEKDSGAPEAVASPNSPVSKNDSRDWEKVRLVKRIFGLPSILERYYCPRFHLDTDDERAHDYLILLHSNRIGVLCLAPSHPVIRKQLQVDEVDFRVNESLSRLDNKVKGKRKKGGQRVKKDSLLCTIRAGEESFKVPACIPGALIEVNARLTDDPSILSADPFRSGFIAIILPPFSLEEQLRTAAYTNPDNYLEIRKDLIDARFRS